MYYFQKCQFIQHVKHKKTAMYTKLRRMTLLESDCFPISNLYAKLS